MHDFAKRYHGDVGRTFNVQRGHIRYIFLSSCFCKVLKRWLRCLAHIINLATQALISTQSKAKYYNPHDVDEHLPDTSNSERDELGLVCAIVVKVCNFLFTLFCYKITIVIRHDHHHCERNSFLPFKDGQVLGLFSFFWTWESVGAQRMWWLSMLLVADWYDFFVYVSKVLTIV